MKKNYNSLQKTEVFIFERVYLDGQDRIKLMLKELLLSLDKSLVIFNATFDIKILLKYLYPDSLYPGMGFGVSCKPYLKVKIYDLYVILRSIHSGYKTNNLADWVYRLFRVKLNKDLRTSFSSKKKKTP